MAFLIGIGGRSAAGKTTLVRNLCTDRIAVVYADDFFYDSDRFPTYKGHVNSDAPYSQDLRGLEEVLRRLKRGETVSSPIYDKSVMKRTGQREIKPTDLIIAEGFHLFNDEDLRDCFDLRVFLDIDDATQYERRKKRQTDLTRSYFDDVVLPMYYRFAEPTKALCHAVIDASKDKESVREEFLSLLRKSIDPATPVYKLLDLL